jgi:hypothetical protein
MVMANLTENKLFPYLASVVGALLSAFAILGYNELVGLRNDLKVAIPMIATHEAEIKNIKANDAVFLETLQNYQKDVDGVKIQIAGLYMLKPDDITVQRRRR